MEARTRALSGSLSVLVIEDDPHVGEWLEEILSLAGHKVRRFTNARTALLEMADDPAEVVVSGVRLPGTGGIAFLARTRKEWPLTEVVLITGHADLDSSRDALALGAHAYLSKPLRAEEILSHVEMAGAQHRQMVEDHLRVCRLQWRNQRLSKELNQLRKAHQSLTRDQQELLVAERRAAVEQVVVTVNHVINNSLAGIGAALRLVDREADRLGEETRVALGIIEEEADSILQLMRDLRGLRRVTGVPYLDDIKMLDLSLSASTEDRGDVSREGRGERGRREGWAAAEAGPGT